MTSKYVEVTVKVPVKDLMNLIKDANGTVIDKDGFQNYVQSPKFKKALATDVIDVWCLTNADDNTDAFEVVEKYNIPKKYVTFDEDFYED